MVPPALVAPHRLPTTRPGDLRREELLESAVGVFGDHGYAGARIDEIARRVGIRRPSVLYHYADKATLYAACLDRVIAEIELLVTTAESAPADGLEVLADAWIDFIIDRPAAARLLLRQMLDGPPTESSEFGATTTVRVRSMLAAIQAALDRGTQSAGTKPLDASEFALILSSTSLVWVAGRASVEGLLGLDTLAPSAIQRHREMLHALTRQLVRASAGEPPVERRGVGEHPRVEPDPSGPASRFETHGSMPPAPAFFPRSRNES